MSLYERRCSGGSAGINSAVFYACTECGACVVEMYGDEARLAHTAWHGDLNEILDTLTSSVARALLP